jgi:uncharacterized membrane protein
MRNNLMFAVFKVRAPGVHAGMDASGFVVPINSGATNKTRKLPSRKCIRIVINPNTFTLKTK